MYRVTIDSAVDLWYAIELWHVGTANGNIFTNSGSIPRQDAEKQKSNILVFRMSMFMQKALNIAY